MLTYCLNFTVQEPEVGGSVCSKSYVLDTRLHCITFLYTAIFTDWFVPDKYQQQSTVTHSDPAMATTRGTARQGREAGGAGKQVRQGRQGRQAGTHLPTEGLLSPEERRCSTQCPLLLRSYSYEWRQKPFGFVTNMTVKCSPAGPWSRRQERIKHIHSSDSVGLLANVPL